jgi:hypothetical protein
MPTVRIVARHPVTDAVLLHMGACSRCRAPLLQGFPECDCGQIHLNSRGDIAVFLSQRLAMEIRRHAPRWRTDRYEHPRFLLLLRNQRVTQLFCALARCVHCGGQTLSTDGLQCACGKSYLRRPDETMLPVGLSSVLSIAPSAHQTQPRQSKTANRRRSRRVPEEIRIMYDLQKGRCYFCSKPLGRFGVRGAFVRDHLRPLLSPYRVYSDKTDFGNLALTCWGCNENKNKCDETAYWKILRVRHGSAWVERQQREMANVCRWREQHDAEKQRKANAAALSRLDVLVDADYQKKLEKKRKREERQRLKEGRCSSISAAASTESRTSVGNERS